MVISQFAMLVITRGYPSQGKFDYENSVGFDPLLPGEQNTRGIQEHFAGSHGDFLGSQSFGRFMVPSGNLT